MHSRNLLMILGFVALAHIAVANTGKDGKSAPPVVQGSVSDAVTKKPVKGVTIFIKTQGNRHEVTTDAAGNFKIPKLNGSSKVTIVLEKKGYKTYRREGVVLKEGMIINFNLEDVAESQEDEIFHPLQRMMDGFR